MSVFALALFSMILLGAAAAAIGYRREEPWQFALATHRDIHLFGAITQELRQATFNFNGQNVRQPTIICEHGAAATPYSSIWSEVEPAKPLYFMYGDIHGIRRIDPPIGHDPNDNYLYIILKTLPRSDRVLIRRNLESAFGGGEGDQVWDTIRPVVAQHYKHIRFLEDLAYQYAQIHSQKELTEILGRLNAERMQTLRAARGGVETLPIADQTIYEHMTNTLLGETKAEADRYRTERRQQSVFLTDIGRRMRDEPPKKKEEGEPSA